LTVAVHTSRLSCWKAGKAPICTPARGSSGESRSIRSREPFCPPGDKSSRRATRSTGSRPNRRGFPMSMVSVAEPWVLPLPQPSVASIPAVPPPDSQADRVGFLGNSDPYWRLTVRQASNSIADKRVPSRRVVLAHHTQSKREPQAQGGNALGAHTRQRERSGGSGEVPLTQFANGLADHRSASVTETPHSPQLKVPRSGTPPVPSVMRTRCIDLPQFRQA
jgi:hypothetical protein